MDTQISMTGYQLASLVGALFNPNPDDDSEPHGPGTPVIHGTLQLRAVARLIVSWAVRLVDTAEVARASAPETRSVGARPAKKAVAPEALGAGLPADVVGGVIAARLQRFADDYCGNGPIRLPFPIDWWHHWPHPVPGPDPDPWRLTLENPRERRIGQLITGAEFQFAATAAGDGALGELFARSARRLLERGAAGEMRAAA